MNEQNISKTYKQKKRTIDEKKLRVHRRSLDWKEHRNDELRKRRHVDEMSPVVEDVVENSRPNTSSITYERKTPTKRAANGHQSKVNRRLEQLARWREEKQLKKKIQAEKKKPCFKVYHLEHVDTVHGSSKNVTNKSKATVTEKVARSSWAPEEPKKAKAQAPATNNKTSRSDRVTRSSVAQKETSKRSRAQVPANESKNSKAVSARRQTRQSTAKPTIAVTKITEKSAAGENNLSSTVTKVMQQVSCTSFAPADFTFCAPPNLSFVWKPFTPTSAANFLFPNADDNTSLLKSPLPRRCSTPKFTGLGPARVKRTPKESRPSTCLEEEPDKTESKTTDTSPVIVTGHSWRRQSVRRSIRLQEQSESACNTPEQPPLVAEEVFADNPRPSEFSQVLEQVAVVTREEDAMECEDESAVDNKCSPPTRNVQRSVRLSKGGLEVTLTELVDSSTAESGVCSSLLAANSMSTYKTVVTASTVDASNYAETAAPALPSTTVEETITAHVGEENKDSSEMEMNVKYGAQTATNQSGDAKENSVYSTPVTSSRRQKRRARRSLATTGEDYGVFAAGDSEAPTENAEMKGGGTPSNKDHVTPMRLTRSGRKSMSVVEEFVQPSPNSATFVSAKKASIRKRKSMATKRDTPSSKVKSPEEWIKLLQQSPMIEMSRRTPKAKTPPENQPAPLAIDFDDIDSLLTDRVSQSSTDGSDDYDTASESFTMLNSKSHPAGDVKHTEPSASIGPNQNGPVSPSMIGMVTGTVDQVESATTQGTCSESAEEGEHDVMYFRNLMKSESARLSVLCAKWEGVNDYEFELSEDVRGQIRTTVGQAQLLMAQRFKQFTGLVDNCEFKTGEKETTCTDLQGFWDMVYFQVEDVDKKFADLDNLKAANWVEVKNQLPKKTKVAKKNPLPKPTASKATAKSKFAAFRAKMLKGRKEEEAVKVEVVSKNTIKVFDAGFFKVTSPIKRSPQSDGLAENDAEEKENKSSSTDRDDEEPSTSQGDQSKQQQNSEHGALPYFSVLTTPVARALDKTPRRRSYVPSVPSPLLCDITPSRAKRRRSYRNTPVPAKLLRQSNGTGRPCFTIRSRDDDEENEDDDTFLTPMISSSRPKKSVMFQEEESSPSPDSTTHDIDMDVQETPPSRPEKRKSVSLASASSPSSTPTQSDVAPEEKQQLCSDLLKYTVPVQEDSSVQKAKSAMKKSKTPLSERRRSVRLNVHFAESPGKDEEKSVKLPQTPSNKVPRLPNWDDDDDETDIFNKENVADSFSSSYVDSPNGKRQSLRKTGENVTDQPSLLFTPPLKSHGTVKDADNLMSFSPCGVQTSQHLFMLPVDEV